MKLFANALLIDGTGTPYPLPDQPLAVSVGQDFVLDVTVRTPGSNATVTSWPALDLTGYTAILTIRRSQVSSPIISRSASLVNDSGLARFVVDRADTVNQKATGYQWDVWIASPSNKWDAVVLPQRFDILAAEQAGDDTPSSPGPFTYLFTVTHFTNATRPTNLTMSDRGYYGWNDDDGAPNFWNGTHWVDGNGGLT